MGLLQDYFNYQRKLEQQQMAGEQITSLMGSAGTDEVPGSGLMANFNDKQARVEFAGGLMGVPGMESQGANLMNQIFQRQQQQGQFEDTLGQDESQYQQTYKRREREFSANFSQGASEFEQSLKQNQSQFDEKMSQELYRDEVKAMQKAMTGAPVSVGDRQKLMDMQLKNQTLYTGMERANFMADQLERFGTESFDLGNEGRAGEMRVLRQNVLNDMKDAWEMGVLQKDEYERLAKTFPEVDSLLGGMKSNISLSAPYRAASRYLEAKFKARIHHQKQAGLPGHSMIAR